MRCYAPIVLAAAVATSARAAPPAHIPGPDGPWDYASVSATPHRLYVGRGYGVMAVDLDTGAVINKLVDGQRVHAVLPIPGGDRVLSTNGDANTATLFHGETGQVIATLETQKKPDAAVYDPSTRLVAVMDGAAGAVTLIDPSAAKVVGEIPVGGRLETAAVDGRGGLFINIEDKRELVRVDLKARKLAARYKLQGCDEPSGLIYSPKSHVLVSACSNGVTKVTSPDGLAVATVKTGEDPDAVIYDAARDRAFVPSPKDGGTLTVIALSGGAPRVVASLPTAPEARTGAYDPSTARVYLPAAQRLVPTSAGRFAAAPGAFEIVSVTVR